MLTTDKKILFVINNLDLGGAERLVVDQVNYLYQLGYNVHLLTLLSSFKKNFRQQVKLPDDKIHSLELSGFDFTSLFAIWNFLRHNRPEIIISHLFFSNTIIRFGSLLFFRQPTLIAYEHNVYSKEKKNRHLLVDKFLSFFTKKIVAVSSPVREFLVKNGIPPKKILIIENGISYDFIENLQAKEEKRRELGLSRDDFVLVSVGNINLQKGHDILIEAVDILKSNNKKIRVLICGFDTSDFAIGLKKIVTERKLDDMIMFLGPRSDVVDIINCSNIFCMPSRWEGLSIALLEAMGMGKAIIVSDIPSMSEIVTHGKNGLLFSSGQSKNLSLQIERLAVDSELLVGLGDRAREKSLDFSIKKNIDRLLEVVNG